MTDIKTATELTEIEQRAYKIAAKTARPALVGIAAWGFVVGTSVGDEFVGFCGLCSISGITVNATWYANLGDFCDEFGD